MKTCFHLRISQAISAATLMSAALCAQAGPVTYTFQTGGPISGDISKPSLLMSDVESVSGQFTYNSQVLAAGNSNVLGLGDDMTIYIGDPQNGAALSGFSGTAGPFKFSDSEGVISVGDEEGWLPPPENADVLELAADPAANEQTGAPPAALTRHLIGFDLPGYRLHNVRLLWLTGTGGIGDFFSEESLPAQLPSFAGRLALDFIPIDGTPSTQHYYSNSVVFEGLIVQAQPVPEPSTATMLACGLAIIGGILARRHRKV